MTTGQSNTIYFNGISPSTMAYFVSPGEDAVIDRNHLGPIPRANVSLKMSGLAARLDPVDPAGSVQPISYPIRQRRLPIQCCGRKETAHSAHGNAGEHRNREKGRSDRIDTPIRVDHGPDMIGRSPLPH